MDRTIHQNREVHIREDDQTQDKTLPKDQRRRQCLIKASETDPGKIWERQWHLQTNYNKCSVLYGHHHHVFAGVWTNSLVFMFCSVFSLSSAKRWNVTERNRLWTRKEPPPKKSLGQWGSNATLGSTEFSSPQRVLSSGENCSSPGPLETPSLPYLCTCDHNVDISWRWCKTRMGRS